MCAPSMFCDREKEREILELLQTRTAYVGFSDEAKRYIAMGYSMGFFDRAGLHALSDESYNRLSIDKGTALSCFPVFKVETSQ
jgi:hypothetical protein